MHMQRHLHVSGRALWMSGICMPGAYCIVVSLDDIVYLVNLEVPRLYAISCAGNGVSLPWYLMRERF